MPEAPFAAGPALPATVRPRAARDALLLREAAPAKGHGGRLLVERGGRRHAHAAAAVPDDGDGLRLADLHHARVEPGALGERLGNC